jgi:L-lactate dehydrogenase complex protein LldG
MNKVCENWQQAFPTENIGPEFFDEFEMRAKQFGTEIFHVNTIVEAKGILIDFVKSENIKNVVAVDCPLQQAASTNDALQALGIEVHTDFNGVRVHSETADLGISGAEFGIAESGSVCVDSQSLESRLVSGMTPAHVVFLNSRNIVKGIADAMTTVSKVFDRGYVNFITGPSRTADIERVLTIGVSGPSRFIVIAVDEQIDGGVSLWTN